LQQPLLIENSISQTTNCCIKASTPKGMANPFAIQRHSGRIPVFTFNWRDDPRKDQAWYDKMKEKKDPVTVAQEIDCDYSASVEGVLIPSDWVQSCIDALQRLGIDASGVKSAALDVADEGKDKNAFAARYGVSLTYLEEWSGVGSSIFKTTEKTFMLCDAFGCKTFQFDSDGLGAAVRGDSEVINERDDRKGAQREAIPFRGSESPVNKDAEYLKSDKADKDERPRTNGDLFANRKAQGWWALRRRIEITHWAITEGRPYDQDDILSIPKDLPNRDKLVSELSQPTYTINNAGKILVNKQPDGMPSPNLADAVMILLAPQEVVSKGWFSM
ncbi:MAG: TerL protein, partial [Patescibacteria group bacterium]|nr:TerL protein [Patescibacteria group bacterium]